MKSNPPCSPPLTLPITWTPPLSTADADDLLHGFRTAGQVLANTDEEAVRDVLLRVAELADALPEVVELDVNPLVLSDTGCIVVDARVRVALESPL